MITSSGNYILNDRIFWIYFIITFFFIIVGLSLIIDSEYPIIISIIWLLSLVLLMLITYNLSIYWGPKDNQNEYICFIDSHKGCLTDCNKYWLIINGIFILLLILSTIWASEIQSIEDNPIKTMISIIIVLGSILLLIFSKSHLISFYLTIVFFTIWLGLSLYSTLKV